MVRPPRRLQELHARVAPAVHDFEQCQHRSPTPGELAQALGTTVAELNEARSAYSGFATVSLDQISDRNGSSWEEKRHTEDDESGTADTRVALLKAVATLPAREQQIVALRFGQDLTQCQIAARLGISQMHVSRLLVKAVTALQGAGRGDPFPYHRPQCTLR